MPKPRPHPLHPSVSLCGNIFRQLEKNGVTEFWRASVTWDKQRVDRTFYDSTYGSAAEAEAMAEAWVEAVREAWSNLPDSRPSAALLRQQIKAVNARFDALRPRWVLVRVYVLAVNGVPAQLRILVSDRGQKMQRREMAVSFQRIPLAEALLKARERITALLSGWFGEDMARAFMARHEKAFQRRSFKPEVGIEIRERLDQYLVGNAP
jgi:hypothetical protein